MEKLRTYEEYMEVLSSFKQGRARCRTNKMMIRDELAALVDAGKLSYEEIGGTLWFFSDEDYFYSAHLYAPKDAPIQMRKQDKDVLVELMGKGERYDGQMERELIDAGYRKGDKYLEYASQLDEIIDDVARQNKMMHTFWEKRGFKYRTATKADYPEIQELWLDKIGMDSYTLLAMTDTELDQMEKSGRCVLLCDQYGRIISSSFYYKRNVTALGYITAASVTDSGFGAAVYYEEVERSYHEGCKTFSSWVRVDNKASCDMTSRLQKLTGKYYWQFVYGKNENTG